MRHHLMTGATGFVGSAIALELLAEPENEITGIVRVADGRNPTLRLRTTLHELIDAYALPSSLHAAVDTRVHATPGDVTETSCGVPPERYLHGCEFWHCAASLQYQDRHKEHIDRTNVTGTLHAMQLARALPARRVNLVSTAYVAGSRSGLVAPVEARVEGLNNHYERSKVAAEDIAARSELPLRILRPAIVIGHSLTRHALNFNGMYGFLRGLGKFRGALERTQPGLAKRVELRLRADPDGDMGLVPVDHVAQEAAALSRLDAPAGIYHLTNPTPPTIGLAIETTFRVAGLRPPELVGPGVELGALDRKLQQGVDFYNSYLVHPKVFDRSGTDSVLGAAAAPGLHLDRKALHAFCDWFMEVLEAEQRALPVAR